jgi:hypothetical protein
MGFLGAFKGFEVPLRFLLNLLNLIFTMCPSELFKTRTAVSAQLRSFFQTIMLMFPSASNPTQTSLPISSKQSTDILLHLNPSKKPYAQKTPYFSEG